MTEITSNKRAMDILHLVAQAVLGTIEEAGPAGAPEGPLYMALMGRGCSLETFQAIMGGLEDAGKIKRLGHVAYATFHVAYQGNPRGNLSGK